MGVTRCSSDYAGVPSAARLTVSEYIERPRLSRRRKVRRYTGNNSRKVSTARKELCYGKAETLVDAEEAARWWRCNLVR